MFVESSVSRGVPLRELGLDEDVEIGVRIDWAPVAGPSSPDQLAGPPGLRGPAYTSCGASDVARVSRPSNTGGQPLQGHV